MLFAVCFLQLEEEDLYIFCKLCDLGDKMELSDVVKAANEELGEGREVALYEQREGPDSRAYLLLGTSELHDSAMEHLGGRAVRVCSTADSSVARYVLERAEIDVFVHDRQAELSETQTTYDVVRNIARARGVREPTIVVLTPTNGRYDVSCLDQV